MSGPVIVVGGGFAGLSAALGLADRGHPVLVLERRPALGGRAYSYTDAVAGAEVDNGQHVLFGCYTETLKFLERIGTRDRLLGPGGLDVSYAAAGAQPTRLRAPAWLPWPVGSAAALFGLGGLSLREKLAIARAIRTLGALSPAAIAALDAETAAVWLQRHGQSAQALMRFWEPLLIAALNESLSVVSARWMVPVVRGVLLGGSSASQVLLPAVPLSELYVTAAASALRARGGEVRTGVAVAMLRVAGGDAGDGGGDQPERVTGVVLANGEVLNASGVILAVPNTEVAALVPPSLADQAPFAQAHRLGSAPIVSVHLWLDREPTAEPFVGLLGTAMQWLFNISRIRGGEPGHLCLVASAAHDLAEQRREDIEKLAIEELHRVFPSTVAATVRRAAAVVQRRSTPSLAPGLACLRSGPATSVANLAVAGDWTHPELPATIEAAVQSGVAAAAYVAGTRASSGLKQFAPERRKLAPPMLLLSAPLVPARM